MSKDAINPEHYKAGGIETIDYLVAKMSVEEAIGFCKGNAIKYLSRVGKKEGQTDQQEYEKAQWYVNKLVELEKSKVLSSVKQSTPFPRTVGCRDCGKLIAEFEVCSCMRGDNVGFSTRPPRHDTSTSFKT